MDAQSISLLQEAPQFLNDVLNTLYSTFLQSMIDASMINITISLSVIWHDKPSSLLLSTRYHIVGRVGFVT